MRQDGQKGVRRFALHWLIGSLILMSFVLHAQEAGEVQSPSPSEFAFPGSTLVHSHRSGDVETYKLVLSPVESAARELQIDKFLRLPARFARETWEMPRNATLDEVQSYLQRRFKERGFTTLFNCSGRDCGRSNLWANYIWQLRVLYGPNTSQFYLAMQHEAKRLLATLYVVERGNRRIYASLDIVEPVDMPQFETVSGIASELRESGHVRLAGTLPSSAWLRGLDLELNEAIRETLAPVAEELRLLSGERIYVVCHLYGPDSTEAQLDASHRWASLLAAELTIEGGPELVAFGVGPLSPLADEVGASRVELVLPD